MQIAMTIAGSDSGGGAGIQADLKTFHQFGVFGTSVITAVTAQNTKSVTAVHAVPVGMVRDQIAAVADDLPPHACKTGMLASAELVETVAVCLRARAFPNYVLDPVMIATSGDRLLAEDAERSVTEYLMPLATVVTPNAPEAAVMAGRPVSDQSAMAEAGRALVDRGARAALIKGGHLDYPTVIDLLVTEDDVHRFEHPRVQTSSTHGTGCTLSAAIAASLALGQELVTAVEHALDFVHQAIATAPDLGQGHGPLNHLAPIPHRPQP